VWGKVGVLGKMGSFQYLWAFLVLLWGGIKHSRLGFRRHPELGRLTIATVYIRGPRVRHITSWETLSRLVGRAFIQTDGKRVNLKHFKRTVLPALAYGRGLGIVPGRILISTCTIGGSDNLYKNVHQGLILFFMLFLTSLKRNMYRPDHVTCCVCEHMMWVWRFCLHPEWLWRTALAFFTAPTRVIRASNL
jgi:hypothetical protein